MLSFKEFLAEVLSKKLDITWSKSDTKQIASFDSAEHHYEIEFDKKPSGQWQVELSLVTFFGTKFQQEMKLGDQFTVMSGLVQATRRFLENTSPDTLFFMVEDKKTFFKPDFYKKLLNKFSGELKNLGYSVKEIKTSTTYKYNITKK